MPVITQKMTNPTGRIMICLPGMGNGGGLDAAASASAVADVAPAALFAAVGLLSANAEPDGPPSPAAAVPEAATLVTPLAAA